MMKLTTLIGRNRAMTTLGMAMDRVTVMSEGYHDEYIPVEDISFESMDRIVIAGERHPLLPVAQQAIATRLGIPLYYLRRCPEDVQAYNMNHWIHGEHNEELFLRFDGEDVRAIFTPKYQPVDNFEIVEGLAGMGFEPSDVVQLHLDDTFMLLNIPNGDKAFSVNKERLVPGISISNSEVGLSSVTVSAYMLRLVCTNGLIATTGVSAKYRHVSRRILDILPEVVDEAKNGLPGQKRRIAISLESRVEDPKATIESFNKRFLLDETERRAVEWGWEKEAGYAMFNIVQGYTRAAQYEGLPAASAHKLQKVGGEILSLVH